MEKIHLKRNAPVAQLYEDAIKYEGAVIAASGALINFSGKKTGRSPKDKRIVYEETSKDDIWVSHPALPLRATSQRTELTLDCSTVGYRQHQDGRAHVRDQPRACHRLPQHQGQRLRL